MTICGPSAPARLRLVISTDVVHASRPLVPLGLPHSQSYDGAGVEVLKYLKEEVAGVQSQEVELGACALCVSRWRNALLLIAL